MSPVSERSATGCAMSDVLSAERIEQIALRDFEHSLPMSLLRARESVMRHFRPLLAAHDVTEQQWRVLRALADTDVPMSVGELAERTFLLGPSLSRMLTSMEERALLHRTAGADARRAELSITSVGRDLVAEISPESEAAYGRINAGLAPGELDQLYALLAKLIDNDAAITNGQKATTL